MYFYCAQIGQKSSYWTMPFHGETCENKKFQQMKHRVSWPQARPQPQPSNAVGPLYHEFIGTCLEG